MKKQLLTAVTTTLALPVAYFLMAIYGPATLVPPPNWPMTQDSRNQYKPFSENSRLVVKTWITDMTSGRIHF